MKNARYEHFIPAAPGWRVLYANRDEAGVVTLHTEPVAAFAVLDDPGQYDEGGPDDPLRRSIVPLVPTGPYDGEKPGLRMEDCSNACALIPPDSDPEEYRWTAESVLPRKKEEPKP